MSLKEIEFSTEDMIISFLNVLAYIISPILLIWAVNTLFDCGIVFKFKTWLAGLVLIMVVKFHFKGSGEPYYPYDYYDDDDDEDEYYYDDDDEEDPEERKARLKAKLIAYQEHKNKKNSPPK